MIKSIYNIRVGDFSLMEDTGKISQFKEWYNFMPSVLFIKKIGSRINEIMTIANKNNSNSEMDLAIAEHEIESLIELNQLQALSSLFTSALVINKSLTGIKSMIKSRKLRKITEKKDLLEYCIKKAFELTGLKIETVGDVVKLKEMINRKADLLNEHNKRKAEDKDKGEGTKRKLFSVALMYCNYTGNIHTTEEIRKMRITDFMEIQDQAISKMESEKKHREQLEKQQAQ